MLPHSRTQHRLTPQRPTAHSQAQTPSTPTQSTPTQSTPTPADKNPCKLTPTSQPTRGANFSPPRINPDPIDKNDPIDRNPTRLPTLTKTHPLLQPNLAERPAPANRRPGNGGGWPVLRPTRGSDNRREIGSVRGVGDDWIRSASARVRGRIGAGIGKPGQREWPRSLEEPEALTGFARP